MSAPLRGCSIITRIAFSKRTAYIANRLSSTNNNAKRGLVLGIYEGEKDNDFILTKAAKSFEEKASSPNTSSLTDLIKLSGLAQKKGRQRVFYGLDTEYPSVAVVRIGKQGAGYNQQEEIEEGRENVREAVAAGVKQLKEGGVQTVAVDPCGDPEAAAESAHLCVYVYNDLKTDEKKKINVDINCYTDATDDANSVNASWKRGTALAEGQKLAKMLMESPANVMTPTRFCEIASEKLAGLPNVEVIVRDQAWAEEKKMGSFLSVSRGSQEPPRFLEIIYKGGAQDQAPVAIVGKGITFDSGGISIKPAASMDAMRADMGGAACTLSSIYTAAKLGLPININGYMPLCENMPSGTATKPGDVVTAMNGKTIQVDNTDAEGRLVLADALLYAESFKPRAIVDMATLTGAMSVALGPAASGAFTNSSLLWETMHKAGTRTGDRVWKMPLFKHYKKNMTECHLADLSNVSAGGRGGGACNAAAFLKEFVTNEHWMHLDIAGVMSNKSDIPYLGKGMTGRPTRTIVEFLAAMSQK